MVVFHAGCFLSGTRTMSRNSFSIVDGEIFAPRGAYEKVSRAQLRKVPVTEQGGRSDRWKGIQHGELADSIAKTLEEVAGVVPVKENLYLSSSKAALIGSYTLGKGGGNTPVPLPKFPGMKQDMNRQLVFLHSNDSKRSLRLAYGSSVFLCSNGCLFASSSFKRKHTSGLEIKDWVAASLDNFGAQDKMIGSLLAILNENGVTRRAHEEHTFAMARAEILPWRLAGIHDRNWQVALGKEAIDVHGFPPLVSIGRVDQDPGMVGVHAETANEAKKGEIIPWAYPDRMDKKGWGFTGSAWDWYNSLTHAIKGVALTEQPKALEVALKTAVDALDNTNARKSARTMLESLSSLAT